MKSEFIGRLTKENDKFRSMNRNLKSKHDKFRKETLEKLER